MTKDWTQTALYLYRKWVGNFKNFPVNQALWHTSQCILWGQNQTLHKERCSRLVVFVEHRYINSKKKLSYKMVSILKKDTSKNTSLVLHLKLNQCSQPTTN